MRTALMLPMIGFASVFAHSAVAQTEVPFTAVSKLVVYKILENGARQVEKESVLRDGRDSLGNRYTNQTGFGKEHVTLWIKSTGDLFQIDPLQRTKHLLTKLTKPPGVIEETAEAVASKTARPDSINGIPCLRLSRFGKVNGISKEVGFTCVSQEYGGLTMYMESPFEVNGQKYLTVIDEVKLQLGVSPPSLWFSVPSDYRDAKPKIIDHSRK